MFNKGRPEKNFPQFYDGHINVTIPYYQVFHTEIINLVKASGIYPRIWLDTGCGTGTLVRRAAEVFPDTLFLLADPSAEMLSVAAEKLKDLPQAHIKFLPGGTTGEVGLNEDEKPDVVTAVLCHHYLDPAGRRKATEKCFGFLKDGGMYITFENTMPMTAKGIETGKENWKRFQIAGGKTADEAENHMKRFNTEYFPITVEEHLSLLRNCGFSVVELLWYSYMQAGFYGIK
jgi:tRNA (cmo5U34)-methyltransferase